MYKTLHFSTALLVNRTLFGQFKVDFFSLSENVEIVYAAIFQFPASFSIHYNSCRLFFLHICIWTIKYNARFLFLYAILSHQWSCGNLNRTMFYSVAVDHSRNVGLKFRFPFFLIDMNGGRNNGGRSIFFRLVLVDFRRNAGAASIYISACYY